MRQLFFFGTLRDIPLLSVVLGRPTDQLDLAPAGMPGFEASAVKGKDFPFLKPDPQAAAQGLLVRGLSDTDVDRLIYYEGAYLYALEPREVHLGGQTVTAEVFFSDRQDLIADGIWSLSRWQAQDAGLAAEAAHEVMAYFGRRPAAEVFAALPTIRMRAQSRMAARAEAPQNIIRHGFTDQDIVTEQQDRPYLAFFALEERRLRFRTFAGTQSAPVDRAVFLAADAVTVLPYDPKRDLVLLIEQFRAGPLMRGDPRPWSLEPIAGRRDVGEDVATTAHREGLEEAGVAFTALEKIASYYPSPGAFSEYLTSYVGITDLAAGHNEIHGLDSEVEDIRSIILPYSQLLDAVATGEIDNGPMLISAMWLGQHRDRLRQTYGSA